MIQISQIKLPVSHTKKDLDNKIKNNPSIKSDNDNILNEIDKIKKENETRQ